MDEKMISIYENSFDDTKIESALFRKYNVKKGLRNEDGTGVCIGVTKIADVVGYVYEHGEKKEAQGSLYYRGIELREIIRGRDNHEVCGFEEVCFLLLFGHLPNQQQLNDFCVFLRENYELPDDFLETHFLRMPSKNLMNRLQQSVLALYDYDDHAEDSGVHNTLLQGLRILAKLPSILVYAYRSKQHRYYKESLIIHAPQKSLSIAENLLYMLRDDHVYTSLEVNLLDMLLIVHADHGGGNNSTFTNVVISSTGTDIYSSITGAIGSLKGPRHGGANRKVREMMEEIIRSIGYSEDERRIKEIQRKILNKQFYDHKGLLYGMGHAIYALSDPRSEVLQDSLEKLVEEKGKQKEYAFYKRFEKCAKEVMYEMKGIHVSSNVDFYSGFIYEMLNIPKDLYTPLFALSRMIGWLSHNIENKEFDGKIMRPATQYVGELKKYINMEDRK